MNILFLLIGLLMLIAGAELFVNSSVNIAKRLGIPTVVIALTIIAIGTSAPETVISFTASFKKHSDLSMSNIFGSNFFNLLFILGLCALIRPIEVKFKEMGPEAWLMVGSTVALLIAMFVSKYSSSERVPRAVGAVMVISFLLYLYLLIHHALHGKRSHENITHRTSVEIPYEETKPLWLSSIGVVISLGVILYGGELTVDHATEIAEHFGIPARIIGLTIIGAGTSLPELIISITACKKRESGIALGTIIGTNIYNLLFILGGSAIIDPLLTDHDQMLDLGMLSFGNVLVMLYILRSKSITRFEGITMLTIYLGYIVYSIV